MWRLVGLLAVGGCGYRECGTLTYWTAAVDPRFDEDGDQYLDLIEACGADYGSFGSHFPDAGLTQLLVDWSRWDTGESTALAYDYLTATEILFRTDHLVKGEVIGMEGLGGMGFHKPAGSFDSPTVTWALTAGEIEVLDGPRSGDFDAEEYKLRFTLTIGAPDAAAPRGYQKHEAEDWVAFDPALWAWDAPGHAAPPPDWVAPG